MSVNNIVEVKLEDDKTVKVYVRSPSRKIVSEADMHRAKVWNNCLMEGIITKMELNLMLRKRKIWTDDEDEKQKELSENISKMEKELYLSDGKKTIEEGKELAVKIRIERNKLRELLGSKIAFEENTAEAISDNARFNYLVSQCVYDESNTEKVYNSLEDYEQKADDPVAYTAAGKMAEIMYGIDDKFEETLPENKWLKMFNLVDEKLNMVNKEGQLVDTKGRRLNDKGQYINEEGQVIDQDGNRLEEDGNFVLKTEYQEEVPKKRARVKKTDSGEQ